MPASHRFVALALLMAATWAGEVLPVNGNFEAVGPDGQAVSWRGGWGKGISLVQEDGNRFVRFQGPVAARNLSITQDVLLDPAWTRVRIAARVRASELQLGTEGWQDFRVNLRFLDAAGTMVGGYAAVPSLRAAGPWVVSQVERDVPAGAVKLSVEPGLFHCGGVADLDDVRVESAGVVPATADAQPAAALTPSWNTVAATTLSPTRAELVLNDVWRFVPAVGDGVAKPPEMGWGMIRVPGSWVSQGWPKVFAVDLQPGAGAMWRTPLSQQSRVWYQRELTIPAVWQGRRIVLDLGLVSTDAKVLLDGTVCGTVAWPSGSVDLTAAAKPGTVQRLSILVVSVLDRTTVLSYMDAHDVTEHAAKLASRGLTGDVVLRADPVGERIDAITVRTSTRKGQLDLLVEVPAALAGERSYVARVVDSDGREAKRFTATATASAGVVRLGWAWPDARRWELDDPHQYTLHLELLGAGGAVADDHPVHFGFREFWIQGRDFLLNGTPVRLRPVFGHGSLDQVVMPEQAANGVAGLLAAGFNFKEFWPGNPLERGSISLESQAQFAAAASAKGLMISAIAPDLKDLLRDGKASPEEEADLLRQWRVMLGRLRNEPAVVMWGSSGNFFGYDMDQDPRLIGQRGHGQYRDGAAVRAAEGSRLLDLLRTGDPTRPLFTHHGGSVGDVHTVNFYLCLIPLQERIEWLEQWRATGDMPFMPVEFGTPLHTTWHRGRAGFPGAVISEPLVAEFGARDLGRQAYELNAVGLRKLVAERFEKEQTYRSMHGAIDQEPVLQAQIAEHNRWTWRTWRTWGITGGMIPWANGHGWKEVAAADTPALLPAHLAGRRGWQVTAMTLRDFAPFTAPATERTPAGDALVANNGPTLAWIAGLDGEAEADRKGFTDRTHLYRGGAALAKQAVVINDTRREQPFTLAWRVVVEGREVGSGSAEGRLAPSTDRLLPIACTLPGVTTRSEGAVELTATIGTVEHRDRFAFRVHAAPGAGKLPALSVLDGVGETTAMLRALGAEVKPWDGVATDRPVVIGRRQLERHGLPPGLDLFVANGGRVLVMAQNPEWLRRSWGLRVAWQQSRQVFTIDAAHPVVAGLDDTDLLNWRGQSTLLEARPDYLNTTGWKQAPSRQPYAGWRWGNRHTVSSAAIEKPHHAGWRPLLECEFDLAYSPLLELDRGQGRITLCTLDLEDHVGPDPAAERLARNLLTWVAQAPLVPRLPTTLLGADADAAQLASLGVQFTRAAAIPTAGLLVLGQAPVDEAALRSFVAGGGRLLVLRRESGLLGATLARHDACSGSLAVPTWPEARGLSPSDLRWRADAPAWLLSGGCEIGADGLLGRLLVGRGVAILLQSDPRQLPADEKTYFRYTRWRQTRAMAQVLANLGATFTGDAAVFTVLGDGSIDLQGLPWQARQTLVLPPAPSPDKAPKDEGVSPAATAALAEPAGTNAGWQAVRMPQPMEGLGPAWAAKDGEAVFRTVIEVPAKLAAKPCELLLGAIDDFDITYLNGVEIGRTGKETASWYSVERRYAIPPGVLRPGANVLAVRVFDHFGGGGLMGGGRGFLLRQVPTSSLGLYHADYRDDFALGDDPFRYYRW